MVEEVSHLGDFSFPAHERCELKREIVRPGVETPGRREVGRETIDREVIEVLGMDDVLEAVRSEISE
ncbi:MAG: hypothetical protein ACRDJ0_05280, partial [Actinomycetota bacterium]